MPLKRILIILIILLILVVGALGVYNFFIKEPIPSEKESDSEEALNGEKDTSVSQADIKTISQEPILNPAIEGQKVKYYLKSNGNVFESNFDGSDKIRISSNVLQNLLKVLWSQNKDKVIAIFEENGLIKKYFYDYNTGNSVLLDHDISYLSWSPEQDKIAYQYYNPQTEDNNISIANSDGSEWNNIFQTRMQNLIVEWPNSSQISIRTRPSGLAQSVVYTIEIDSNNLQKIIENYGLTALWSPTGDKLLFSETNSQGKNLKLKIADLSNQAIKELNFVTLPEKCVWSQDNRTLFCAVPKEISDSVVLPDDYYKKSIYFADEFWQISLETEEAVKIYILTDKDKITYDAIELLLSPSEDYLLFINRKNEFLYSLEL